MAQTHGRLATSAPAATTNATAFTAVAVTIISSIFVCNTSAADTVFRLFLVPSAGAAGVTNALYYDLPLRANDTFLINGVPDLEIGDFLVVYSGNGLVAFTISGLEIT